MSMPAQSPRYDTDPYIRATVLTGLATLLNLSDTAYGALLQAHGLEPRQPDDFVGVISIKKYAALLETIARTHDRPDFGLELAMANAECLPNLAPLSLIGSLQPSLGDASNALEESLRYFSNGFLGGQDFHPEVEEGNIFIHVDPSIPETRQLTEFLLASFFLLGLSLSEDKTISPKKVHFQHDRPASTETHARIFRTTALTFNAPRSQFVYDLALRDLTTLQKTNATAFFIRCYMKFQGKRLERLDKCTRSRAALTITNILGSGNCTAQLVAESMGMHPKKMQRMLKAQDTNFVEVLDEVRKQMALRMLRESAIPVSRIASLLDYSDQAAFTTAFRRWTEITPSDFRKLFRV